MQATYPPLEGPVPNPFNADHVRAAEDALRQLAVANELIKRCESCKIPVSEARADCDGLCQFLTTFLDQVKGQGSDLPLAVS